MAELVVEDVWELGEGFVDWVVDFVVVVVAVVVEKLEEQVEDEEHCLQMELLVLSLSIFQDLACHPGA